MSAKKQAEEALVFALACGETVEAAARRCGVDEKVVRRKLADNKFRRRVVPARTNLTEQTCGLLTVAGLEAAKALVELATAGGAIGGGEGGIGSRPETAAGGRPSALFRIV